MPFVLYPYPRAILHIDADAFFASVEQAMNPAYRGKPVVTGKERGIIACASYEAKALGVARGISLSDAKRMCPGLIVLPSDYETYSLYSKRMFSIIRRFTPTVEEYSVDEAYADISGMRRVYHASYEQIAARIKNEIQAELDINVSVGLSITRLLAKLASKHDKPDGLTVVPGTRIHKFLEEIPVSEVWGIGPNGSKLLSKYGVRTARDFVSLQRGWVSRMLHKPGRDIWDELRGKSVYGVHPGEKSQFLSMSKGKTFSVPSADKHYVYARLVRNIESVFIKLRRYKLRAGMIGILLRHKNYEEEGFEAKLNRPTSSTQEVMDIIKLLFDRTYRPGCLYRTTMVFLGKLTSDDTDQLDLFEDRLKIDQMQQASRAIDAINKRFGKHTVALGSSLYLADGPKNEKDVPPVRRKHLLKGENKRQRLRLPMIMLKV